VPVVAPAVTITAAPSATTLSPDASFSFRANLSGTTFECRLDGGDYTPCSSPQIYQGLAPGAHTFAVRGAKAGVAGPAASASWTVEVPDTTAPTVSITAAPPAATTDTDASFSFSASENGSSFACSLDGGAFSGCSSPASYNQLAVGGHTFEVNATDAAGNTGAAAKSSWTVQPLLPDLVVSELTKSSVTVTNVGNATAGASVVSVTLIGTFSIPTLGPGESAKRVWSVCRSGTLSAVADRGKAVAESNEDNNVASLVSTCF
jgi:CARDB